MQIKRFEADDMNQALRLVKREFGDDAVILSAKEVRPSGIFKSVRKKRIVVTAAMGGVTGEADSAAHDLSLFSSSKTDPKPNAFNGVLSHFLKPGADVPKDRVSLSTRPSAPAPLSFSEAPSGAHQVKKTFSDPASSPMVSDPSAQVSQRGSTVRNNGENQPAPSDAFSHRESDPLRSVSGKPILEKPFYQTDRLQHRIAVVGPPGVGKTSMVVKLARYCQSVEKKKTAVITLDRYRIGANGFLENAAKIMDLSVTQVRDADELSHALNSFSDYPVVLIDTPGIGNREQTIQNDICDLLRMAEPHEVHLVINATVRRRVMADTIDAFSSFGVNRLMLTHLDEYESRGDAPADLYPTTQLPTAFCGTGVDLFDGLQVTRASASATTRPRFFSMETINSCQGTETIHSETPPSASPAPSGPAVGKHYMAVRDSGLFHHPSCKFAKRSGDEGVIMFGSMAKAVAAGFDPCQGCCAADVSTKSSPLPSMAASHQYANVF